MSQWIKWLSSMARDASAARLLAFLVIGIVRGAGLWDLVETIWNIMRSGIVPYGTRKTINVRDQWYGIGQMQCLTMDPFPMEQKRNLVGLDLAEEFFEDGFRRVSFPRD